jgi:hypothetical protein
MSHNAAHSDHANQRGDVLAARRLLAEIERLKHAKDTAERQLTSLTETLELLVSDFPAVERSIITQRLAALGISGYQKKKISDLRDNVISIFTRTPLLEMSIPEIKSALNEQGSQVDLKALYNVINYLATTGRLRRVTRGRYVINGLGASLDIDNVRDDGTHWATEHDV